MGWSEIRIGRQVNRSVILAVNARGSRLVWAVCGDCRVRLAIGDRAGWAYVDAGARNSFAAMMHGEDDALAEGPAMKPASWDEFLEVIPG